MRFISNIHIPTHIQFHSKIPRPHHVLGKICSEMKLLQALALDATFLWASKTLAITSFQRDVNYMRQQRHASFWGLHTSTSGWFKGFWGEPEASYPKSPPDSSGTAWQNKSRAIKARRGTLTRGSSLRQWPMWPLDKSSTESVIIQTWPGREREDSL